MKVTAWIVETPTNTDRPIGTIRSGESVHAVYDEQRGWTYSVGEGQRAYDGAVDGRIKAIASND